MWINRARPIWECLNGGKPCPLPFSERAFHPPAQRTIFRAVTMSWSHDLMCMWTARPAVMVAAKPIIYWAQGAMAAQIAAADFRRHSQCAVNQRTSQLTSLTGCLMANFPPSSPLERDTRLGVYHMSPTYQRFTTEDDRRGEMRVVSEWREGMDDRKRKTSGCTVCKRIIPVYSNLGLIFAVLAVVFIGYDNTALIVIALEDLKMTALQLMEL